MGFEFSLFVTHLPIANYTIKTYMYQSKQGGGTGVRGGELKQPPDQYFGPTVTCANNCELVATMVMVAIF